jgi:ABC-type dipeptide/oligopeptide/nickel transport system ATPase subunit
MMTLAFPDQYRHLEVTKVIAALSAGDCVSVIGLSGAGKSNFLSFLSANRNSETHPLVLVDGNRLADSTAGSLFQSISDQLGNQRSELIADPFVKIEEILGEKLQNPDLSISILFDLGLNNAIMDSFFTSAISSRLRFLRDQYKYRLTYVFATRRPLPEHTELSELILRNTIWLGPLSQTDADWSIDNYCQRKILVWDDASKKRIAELSGGYPSLLRGVCEAYEDGTPLETKSLSLHSAVRKRLEEFWADQPAREAIHLSGLDRISFFQSPGKIESDSNALTAKEFLLMKYFQTHPGQICSKEDLIGAVWSEDRMYEQGIRDDSLAQMIRRLREKVEANPSKPIHILTIPGRGYRYVAEGR